LNDFKRLGEVSRNIALDRITTSVILARAEAVDAGDSTMAERVGRTQITVQLDDELHHRVRVGTVSEGTTMTAEIIAFLRERYGAPGRAKRKKVKEELDQATA
jgi:hypothetical protein